jgi:hypothetical protein
MTGRARDNAGRAMKIWIDLDNTPHVPFFRTISAHLRDACGEE